jgi:hypothetical protein
MARGIPVWAVPEAAAKREFAYFAHVSGSINQKGWPGFPVDAESE